MERGHECGVRVVVRVGRRAEPPRGVSPETVYRNATVVDEAADRTCRVEGLQNLVATLDP